MTFDLTTQPQRLHGGLKTKLGLKLNYHTITILLFLTYHEQPLLAVRRYVTFGVPPFEWKYPKTNFLHGQRACTVGS